MTTSPTIKYRINLHYQEERSRYYAEDLGNGILLKMVEIPSGTFMMGSPETEAERRDSEGPQHKVRLGSFFMGMYPVTQDQWQAVANLDPVNQKLDPDPSGFKGADRPVERVAWHDAMEFCARLSKQTKRDYDLPTEAEWEYACRASPIFVPATSRAGDAVGDEMYFTTAISGFAGALRAGGAVSSGTTLPFHFGETITTDLANYNGADEKYGAYDRGPKGIYREVTTPVGSFPANAFGLYDMHGNVWEWCADHWHDNYADKPEELKQDGSIAWRSNNENASRSLRGGSWNVLPRGCRSAIRYYSHPDERDSYYGFRVVCRAARTS